MLQNVRGGIPSHLTWPFLPSFLPISASDRTSEDASRQGAKVQVSLTTANFEMEVNFNPDSEHVRDCLNSVQQQILFLRADSGKLFQRNIHFRVGNAFANLGLLKCTLPLTERPVPRRPDFMERGVGVDNLVSGAKEGRTREKKEEISSRFGIGSRPKCPLSLRHPPLFSLSRSAGGCRRRRSRLVRFASSFRSGDPAK